MIRTARAATAREPSFDEASGAARVDSPSVLARSWRRVLLTARYRWPSLNWTRVALATIAVFLLLVLVTATHRTRCFSLVDSSVEWDDMVAIEKLAAPNTDTVTAFVRANTPVVITDIGFMDELAGRVSLDYLGALGCGNVPVGVHTRGARAGGRVDGFQRRNGCVALTFAEFVDWLIELDDERARGALAAVGEASAHEVGEWHDVPPVLPHHEDRGALVAQCPALATELALLRFPASDAGARSSPEPERVLGISAAGVRTDARVERHPTRFVAQLAGSRHVLLAPPRAAALLATMVHVEPGMGVDVYDPVVARALGPLAVELHAGEVLYIPPGWLTWAETVEASVAVDMRFAGLCVRLAMLPDWLAGSSDVAAAICA